MKVVETILAVPSDMHTGGSTALFPRGGFQADGIEGNHVSPNAKQTEIYPVFARFGGEVGVARKNKRLIIVMLGDAIDGFHHGSMQESLFLVKDQCAAHVILMKEFMKRAGFNAKKGDELYYVRGTEAHVGETENDIARELGAKKSDSGLFVHEVLELNINGKIHAFAHHGKNRGNGPNEGNALRNFLRDTRADRKKDGFSRLDFLWSGHTHGHTFATHEERQPDGNFHIFAGIICPSFQAKTKWALGKVPMAVNSVGGTYAKLDVTGEMIGVPRFVIQTTKDG